MNLWFDLKYAGRLLRKSWGYSLMCASVVALSVGLAVWVNALAYSQLRMPLGIPGSEEWQSVQVAADAKASLRPRLDAYTWQELQKRLRSAEPVGAFADKTAVLSEGEASTSLRATRVTPRVFARVSPLLGRTFADADALPDAGRVAILSYDAWQTYFAGDPKIIGRTVRIDAAPVQIVGVMRREFLAIDDYELWEPLSLPALARPQDSAMNVFALVRLRDGRTVAAAESEMKAAVAQISGDYPDLFNAARRTGLVEAHRMFTHGITPIIMMMTLMAGGVLLLGCVNISMVFLARLLERSRELALRTALGSARGRLLRQCLLETALIVLIGLGAGYALAWLGIEWTHGVSAFGSRVLASGRSTNLPMMRGEEVVAAIVFAVVIWLLSTLIPAWRITRQDASVVLGGNGKGATVRSGNRGVGLLVGLQVVISCLVLVTCGSLVVAIRYETAKPSGLATQGVWISTNPTELDSRYGDPTARVRYWDDLVTAIGAKLPGASVAFTTAPPTRPARVATTVETRQGADKQGALTLPLTIVSEGYFETMGVRLRSGRLFDSTDNAQSLPVAIVDEKMAARFWPEGDALGKRIRINSSEKAPWLTIAGIVSNARGGPYRTDADLGTVYQPIRQAIPNEFHVLVRAPNAVSDPRVAIRAAAFGVDRDLPLHNLQTLDDYLAAVTLSYPAMTKCFIAIALITALLAASGLFGLISRSVAQRTQEVGIRRALGATPWRATSMFLRQGAIYLTVSMIGLGLGVLIMPALSRAIPNILEHAPVVTVGVVLLMAAVIATASYLPTRRAVALEPGDALRYE